MRTSERYSASNGSCLHQDSASQGRRGAGLAPKKTPRPKHKIQSPQTLVKFPLNPSPTPPPTEVYSRHDRRTKFPTPPPPTSQIMGEELESHPLTPLPPCGRGGTHRQRRWEVRVLAKQIKPHPEGTCEGRYPDNGKGIFPKLGPCLRRGLRRGGAPGSKIPAPPRPKSFHPRSCSQTGVGANPAQA